MGIGHHISYPVSGAQVISTVPRSWREVQYICCKSQALAYNITMVLFIDTPTCVVPRASRMSFWNIYSHILCITSDLDQHNRASPYTLIGEMGLCVMAMCQVVFYYSQIDLRVRIIGSEQQWLKVICEDTNRCPNNLLLNSMVLSKLELCRNIYIEFWIKCTQIGN